LERKGVKIAHVTLHVGIGTFKPIAAKDVRQHKMHAEFCSLPDETAKLINETKRKGGKIVAVGTTVVRTLETMVDDMGAAISGSGWTQKFIYPGYTFRIIDALITNFHLPKSTLMLLVSAFAGYENIMNAYQEAIKLRYRFYSFGDAMLII
jgi:S-adenosylmethionine:tRNA ribosyltransferase-isomerase